MAKNPFGNVRRGFGSTVNFSTTINGITYTDTDAFLAYRKGLYSKSFKIGNKKIESGLQFWVGGVPCNKPLFLGLIP